MDIEVWQEQAWGVLVLVWLQRDRAERVVLLGGLGDIPELVDSERDDTQDAGWRADRAGWDQIPSAEIARRGYRHAVLAMAVRAGRWFEAAQIVVMAAPHALPVEPIARWLLKQDWSVIDTPSKIAYAWFGRESGRERQFFPIYDLSVDRLKQLIADTWSFGDAPGLAELLTSASSLQALVAWLGETRFPRPPGYHAAAMLLVRIVGTLAPEHGPQHVADFLLARAPSFAGPLPKRLFHWRVQIQLLEPFHPYDHHAEVQRLLSLMAGTMVHQQPGFLFELARCVELLLFGARDR